jgi:nucleoside-diphosphate-sugar epimerase
VRVAITGADGFLGSHVLARIVGAGMDVTMVGPDTGRCRYAASLIASGRIRFLECDPWFRDASRVHTALGPIDALLLLGEVALDTIVLAHLIRELEGCPRFILASSLEVYGDSTAGGVPQPVSTMGVVKLAAEQALRTFADVSATTTILRYASIFGPSDLDGGIVARFVRDGLAGRPLLYDGDGGEERDYLHVCDAADATFAALERRLGGIYDVGTGIATSTLDLAHLVAQLTGGRSRPLSRGTEQGEPRPRRVIASTARAWDDLRFAARRTLACGVKEEIGWIRSQTPAQSSTCLAATA